MTFSDAVSRCFNRYAQFWGRAPRAEYWWFVLFLVLGTLACCVIDAILIASIGIGGFVTFFFLLGMITPLLSVGVRRLHDIGRGGWWLWIGLVPVAGAVVLLVFHLAESTPGRNAHGLNPYGR